MIDEEAAAQKLKMHFFYKNRVLYYVDREKCENKDLLFLDYKLEQNYNNFTLVPQVELANNFEYFCRRKDI